MPEVILKKLTVYGLDPDAGMPGVSVSHCPESTKVLLAVRVGVPVKGVLTVIVRFGDTLVRPPFITTLYEKTLACVGLEAMKVHE